jgi:hypothetical protein
VYLTASLFFSTIRKGPALEGFSSLGSSSATSSPAMAVAEQQIVRTNCKLASHMCCMPERQQASCAGDATIGLQDVTHRWAITVVWSVQAAAAMPRKACSR